MIVRKIDKRLVAALSAAMVLLCVSGILSYLNSRKLLRALEDVRIQQINRDMEADLLGALHQAESAMFAFIVTGDETFLAPYAPAIDQARNLMRQLSSRPEWLASHGDDVLNLKDQVALRLELMEDRITKRREAGFEAAAATVATGQAKALMDQIRQTLEHLQRAEDQLLFERQQKVSSRVRKTLLFDVVFGTASLLVLGTVCGVLLVENARRKENEAALQESRDLLETRVEQRTAELANANQLLEHNIQELRRSEQALRESERKLSHTAGELAMKNEDLEMLVYIVSHDLRSPLVNVQGFGRELQRSAATIEKEMESCEKKASIKEALQDMAEAMSFVMAGVNRMDALLSGFLKYSRLGRQAVRPERLQMTKMFQSLAETMEFQLKQCGGKINVENLPECIGDKTQVSQVFSNLLDNAIKYRNPSRPLDVRVQGQENGNYCTIKISDNGVGIPEDQKARVFQLFHRVGEVNVNGEGLGLTIARRIVERNHGRIWVEAKQGEGCTFFVELPKANSQAAI